MHSIQAVIFWMRENNKHILAIFDGQLKYIHLHQLHRQKDDPHNSQAVNGELR